MNVLISRGQQVITLADAAQIYQYSAETLRQRINRNQERFEGESWVIGSDELAPGDTKCSAGKIRRVRVITKRGLAILAPMLKGMAAAQRSEAILDEYFKREESFQTGRTLQVVQPAALLPAEHQARTTTVELMIQNAVLAERDQHRQREIELLNELRKQDARLLALLSPGSGCSPTAPVVATLPAAPAAIELPANDIPPGFIALTDAAEQYGLSRAMTERLAKNKGCRFKWGSKYSAQRGGMTATKCVSIDDYERAFYDLRRRAIQIGGGWRLEGLSQRFELNRSAPRCNAPAGR